MPRKLKSAVINWGGVTTRLTAILERATPQQFADGLSWYTRANMVAAEIAESDFPPVAITAAAGTIAALSPQCDWALNVQQARDLAAGKPVSNVAIRCDKAYRCWGGEEPTTVLNGPKESAFYACIVDPIGARSACIDRHMFRAALDVHSDAEIRLWSKRRGVYEGIARAVARIADRKGIPVPAAQAIIWTVIRDDRRNGG